MIENITQLTDEELEQAIVEGRETREVLNANLNALVDEQEKRRIKQEVASMDPRLVAELKGTIIQAEGIESEAATGNQE